MKISENARQIQLSNFSSPLNVENDTPHDDSILTKIVCIGIKFLRLKYSFV
jgi:hypothetical protein